MKVRLMGRITDLYHPQVVPFLDNVMQNEKSERVRKEAVQELNEYHSQKSLNILLRTARNDPSVAVRTEAIDGIGHIESTAAEEALIEIAQTGSPPSIRREAIDKLRDMASDKVELSNVPKVVKCFQSIIDNQEEQEEIQCKALEALKDIEHKDVRTYITKTARSHLNQEIRREAQEIVAEWIRDR